MMARFCSGIALAWCSALASSPANALTLVFDFEVTSGMDAFDYPLPVLPGPSRQSFKIDSYAADVSQYIPSTGYGYYRSIAEGSMSVLDSPLIESLASDLPFGSVYSVAGIEVGYLDGVEFNRGQSAGLSFGDPAVVTDLGNGISLYRSFTFDLGGGRAGGPFPAPMTDEAIVATFAYVGHFLFDLQSYNYTYDSNNQQYRDNHSIRYSGTATLDYEASLRASGLVPEPRTWACMVFGFGVAGAVLRRRVRRAAASLAY